MSPLVLSIESDIISPILQRRKLSLSDTKCTARVHMVVSGGLGIESQDPLTGLYHGPPEVTEVLRLTKWQDWKSRLFSETICRVESFKSEPKGNTFQTDCGHTP